MKTLVCRNSKCQREFTPDSDHRCLPYCCPMCQREAADHTQARRAEQAANGMTYLRDLKTDYESYVLACVEVKAAILPFNDWLQNKVVTTPSENPRASQAKHELLLYLSA